MTTAPTTARPGVTRRLIAACAVVALAALAALIGVAPQAKAADDSTFRMAITSSISTFNPFLAYFAGETIALGEIYPTLVQGNDDLSDSKPYLADSWETSADQLTWTFAIHQGLTWSDGQPITAKDAAWTINLIMTNEAAATANGSLVENFSKVEATDDSTLVITTKQPQANMLTLMTPITGIPIVPQHIWESKVADLANDKNTDFPVVGYGPYTLTDYKTDQYATLTANQDYLFGAPKPSTLILQSFQTSDAAVAALRSGQLDQVGSLTATQFDSIKGDKGITTFQALGPRWSGVEVNGGARSKSGKALGTGNAALKNPEVRKAIAYGIDRKTLLDKVMNGLGNVGAGYLPSAYPQWEWKPSADQTIGYDPDQAGQLLDAAGYTKGSDGVRVDPSSGKPLELRLGIHAGTVTDSQIANYLVGWMKDIGITLKVQSQSNTALNANLAKGDWDLLMDSWSTGPDPTYLLSIQTCGVLPDDSGENGNTDSFFCDPEYDKLYAEQQTQFDQGERADTVKQMQQILYEANQDIILYVANDLSAVRTSAWQGFFTGEPDDQGYYSTQNTFGNLQRVAPVSAADSDSGSSTGLVIGIVVAAVVVVAVVGFVLLRRRTTAGDRE